MSAPINDGGPAFPRTVSRTHTESSRAWVGGSCTFIDSMGGMTLRDWFAGQALKGLLACDETQGTNEFFASWSYRLADAMLKAREVQP